MDIVWAAHVLWFLAGVAFLLAELAWPGFVLLFFALGAFAAALLSYATALGASGQVVAFLSVSLAGVGLLRRMFLRAFQGRTHSPAAEGGAGGLDDPGAGKTAVVTRAIAPGVPGEIKFRGSFWRAEAAPEVTGAMAEGETVVILGLTQNDTGAYQVRPASKEAS